MAEDANPSPTRALTGASETRTVLSALVMLAAELNGSLEPAVILQTVMEKAREVMHAEACSLLFIDEAAEELVYEIAMSPSGQTLREHYRLPLGEGLAGYVARTGEAILTNAPQDDPRFHRETDRESGFTTHNLITVPLKARGSLFGVAQVLNKNHGRDFTDDDLHLFSAFADLAAVAIVNARLHEEVVARRRLDEEMAVARNIQKSFLPDSFPVVEGLSFEGSTEPARAVGGDFFDIFTLADERICLTVADVSGKGAPASLYMACLHAELHSAFDFLADPVAVLQRLNRTMHSRSRNGAFVTMVMIILELGGREMNILSAGHPPPLLYTPESHAADFISVKNGMPLGVLTDEVYTPTRITFPKGATLLAFSDGVPDARSGDDEEFGLARLQRTFGLAAAKTDDILPRLKQSLRTHIGKATQYDDTTFALVRSS